MNRTIVVVSLALIALSCSPSTRQAVVPRDPHSFARPEEVVVTHLHLDLTVSFERRQLSGTATLTIDNKTGAPQLLLDTRDMTIEAVTLLPEDKAATWSLGETVPLLGQRLAVDIAPTTKQVAIRYATSPNAAALQWLEPAQTSGKKHPFLFTQSQAILARTWVPCQDGPGVRMTYSARIQVPPDLLALMSASNPTVRSRTGLYEFRMDQPIPSYLLALAVGDIAFKPVGARSGVYAEPSVIEKASWELADTEKMIEAAEKLYGPYRWERYDIIVLPPSFPFGGMENPRLTFATPTILAGDRSLVSLVAHELAHSWSGNLVTNATWNDFWLNEGFTTYFENRIMEATEGRPYSEMLAQLSLQDLRATVAELGDTSAMTKLKLDLEGRDPDEGVSDIAYNKGALFLRHLEEKVGREVWDIFLRNWFDEHAFRSSTTEEFVTYLQKKLIKGNQKFEKELDIHAWIYESGLPTTLPVITSEEFKRVDGEVDQWKSGAPPKQLSVTGWTTHHWLHFLKALPDQLTIQQMVALDAAFGFTRSGNSEILALWLQKAVASDYRKADGALESFLTGQGRRKFLRPLYAELAKTPDGMARAKAIYAKARPSYHSVSANTIDGILGESK
ncbi:MAG: M1 family metallopeptidase [Bacteroidetes bacterium]|nr:M1 family metallopeptidase [Bacteroidota bacterium]